jgi:hypothetical protein
VDATGKRLGAHRRPQARGPRVVKSKGAEHKKGGDGAGWPGACDVVGGEVNGGQDRKGRDGIAWWVPAASLRGKIRSFGGNVEPTQLFHRN